MPDVVLTPILIVDDEAPQMKALCQTLQDYGFETVGYSSPSAALRGLMTKKFDILLTDLNMPEIDGISLIRSALKIDPDMACVIMTGQGTVATAVEAMQAGAKDYILKPFKISTALPVLNRSLEMRRLKLENASFREREQEFLEELKRQNEELASFSSAVAHDLRGPLRAINGFGQILAEEYASALDEDGRDALDRLRKAARKMNKLIEGLLALAGVSQAELHLADVDLSALAQKIAVDVPAVRFEIEPGMVVVADERLMMAALENLLGNAIKFSSLAEEPLVRFDRVDTETGKAFRVQDNGIGFNPAYGEKLFKPFERLHSEQEFAGSGIGLSTVQRIIQRHNGTIWAESQPGEGATFYFTLQA